MFNLPNIDECLNQFDSRLDKLDLDMTAMVILLTHMDATLTKLLELQQHDCSIIA